MKIAALVAARNAQRHLGECLDSLGEFDEVALWDDDSTDRTQAIAAAFGVKVNQNYGHKGQSETKRRLALDSDADAICFADSDDVRIPGALTRQANTLRNGADIVLSPVLDMTGNELSVLANPWACAWWGHPSIAILWRRSLVEKLLKDPLREGAPEQQLMVRAIAAQARFAFTGRPVAKYRRSWSPDQAHHTSGETVLACRDRLKVIAPARIADMLHRLGPADA